LTALALFLPLYFLNACGEGGGTGRRTSPGTDIYYLDADGDGYGNPAFTLQAETRPSGYVSEGTDCDDANAMRHPGAAEVHYNGQDDDCNSATLDDDLDRDGFPLNRDCDDADASLHPGATEIPYNGQDDDCDGSTPDDDLDADGYPARDECDDTNASVNPDKIELCDDGIDNDCDGGTDCEDASCLCLWWHADSDQDGFGDPAVSIRSVSRPEGYVSNKDDCNDAEESINPNAVEICGNRIDEDCTAVDRACIPCPNDVIAERCQCGVEAYETGYCCDGYYQNSPCQDPYPEDQTGLNFLTREAARAVDAVTNVYRDDLNYARVGIVYGGTVVYTKSYKDGAVDATGQWASISKPATAMIVMQLREAGFLNTIDDNVWEYAPKYIGAMPPPWESSPLMIRHLLLHQGGVQFTAPLWSGDYLNLMFEPGTDTYYTSAGYGIIGDVIRGATGIGFDTLVEEYLAIPVKAMSIASPDQIDEQSEIPHSDWQAPGTWINSSVEDLAKFTTGVMNHIYVPETVLLDEMLTEYTPNQGLGWRVSRAEDILYAGHTGDNGYQKSVVLIDISRKMSAAILFSGREVMTDERIPWASAILAELASSEDPILEAPPCPGVCCESLCDVVIVGECMDGVCCATLDGCRSAE
jgi:CubicO group peptidase (beta-lactamase class C family)